MHDTASLRLHAATRKVLIKKGLTDFIYMSP